MTEPVLGAADFGTGALGNRWKYHNTVSDKIVHVSAS